MSSIKGKNGFDDVIIPDRYEILARANKETLNTLIVPVEDTLPEIDKISAAMRISDRGAFAILRGESGAGKTTFLHTLNLFRQNVATLSILGGESVPDFLRSFLPNVDVDLQIIVLEEREAAVSFTDQELESWLHSINAFIRGSNGKKCLVVWPCNSDYLKDRLIKLDTSKYPRICAEPCVVMAS